MSPELQPLASHGGMNRRFTHCPSGNGTNTAQKTPNPACDFQFPTPKPQVMKDYGFKVGTILRSDPSRDEILTEFQPWKETR